MMGGQTRIVSGGAEFSRDLDLVLVVDEANRRALQAAFSHLQAQQVFVPVPGVGALGVLSLPDLVRAKKTQRDNDWPMIRRMIEADVLRAAAAPTAEQVLFWLREARTPEILRKLAARPLTCARRRALPTRP